MKKLLFLLALCALTLGILPGAALATSVEDLTALATFFPADTIVFGAVRSDEAYFETLNSLLVRIERRTESPIMTLEDIINQSIGYSGLSFEDDIRPWLGDTIAAGLTEFETRSGGNGVIVLAVADRDPLAELLEETAEDSSDGEEYTQYEYETATLRLYGNALLLANDEDLLDGMGEGDRLSDSADFEATLALLPEPDYDVVVYVQTGLILEAAREEMETTGGQSAATMQLFNQFSAGGSEAIGFTVLDGSGYAIDIAARPVEDADPNIASATDAAPLDFDFAANVPADAALYVQDTNFGVDVQRSINMLALLMELGIDQEIAQQVQAGRQVDAVLDSIDRNDVRAFINLSFAGFTGLNLENDVLANMNGNVAMYLGLTEDDLPAGAFLVEMDEAASAAIFASAENALTQYEAVFTIDGNVITLPQPLRLILQDELDAETLENPAFDLLLGHNETLFAVGSRAAVEYSLAPGDESLATSENFIAAQAYFLADSETLFYANLAPIIQYTDDVLANQSSQYGNDVLKVLSLFNSASITSRVDDDGSAIVRLLIELRAAE